MLRFYVTQSKLTPYVTGHQLHICGIRQPAGLEPEFPYNWEICYEQMLTEPVNANIACVAFQAVAESCRYWGRLRVEEQSLPKLLLAPVICSLSSSRLPFHLCAVKNSKLKYWIHLECENIPYQVQQQSFYYSFFLTDPRWLIDYSSLKWLTRG